MSRNLLIFVLVVAGIGGFIVWTAAKSIYLKPRQDLISGIERAQNTLQQFRRERTDAHPPIISQIDEIVNRTLGSELQVVETELRARLNRIVESVPLRQPTVTTGRPRSVRSPAERVIDRRNPFRSEIDFNELDATVRGLGSLEDAIRLIDAIEAAPWIKRIEHVDFKPRNDGEHFEVTVRLITIYVPGRDPDSAADLPPHTGRGFARIAPFVAADHFRVPAPPAPPPRPRQEERARPDPEPAPPPFPYDEWVVTGVAVGSAGPEVWLVNRRTNASQMLFAGQMLGEVRFVGASDEEAEFLAQGDARFTVRVGSTMSSRIALK